MSYRIIIEEPCEHGEWLEHLYQQVRKHGYELACKGVAATVLTAPSDSMVERAVSALRAIRSRNGWTLTEAARAALTAALFGEEEETQE